MRNTISDGCFLTSLLPWNLKFEIRNSKSTHVKYILKTALNFKNLFYSNHTKRAFLKIIIIFMKHVIWLDSAYLVYSIYL